MWGRTIGRALYKQHYKLQNDCDLIHWLRGVCYATLTCEAHVPILYDINLRVYNILGDGQQIKYQQESYTDWGRPGDTEPMDWLDTVFNLNVAYDLDEADLLDFHSKLRELNALPAILDCALISRVLEVDEL